MDFELPEELRMLKETVRTFVDRELIPIEMTSMDGSNMKPDVRAAVEEKAKKLGLWHLDVPAEYGGQGLNLLGMVVVWEEIARTIAVPPRGPLVFGPDLRPILFTLTPEQKEKYLLPGTARGEDHGVCAVGARRRLRSGRDADHRRERKATTISSTATSAGSPTPHAPTSSSSSPPPTAARAAAAACRCSWSMPTRRAQGGAKDPDRDGRRAVRDRARRRESAGGEPDRQGGRRHARRAVLDHRRAALSGLPRARRRQALPRPDDELRQAARHVRRSPWRTGRRCSS